MRRQQVMGGLMGLLVLGAAGSLRAAEPGTVSDRDLAVDRALGGLGRSSGPMRPGAGTAASHSSGKSFLTPGDAGSASLYGQGAGQSSGAPGTRGEVGSETGGHADQGGTGGEPDLSSGGGETESGSAGGAGGGGADLGAGVDLGGSGGLGATGGSTDTGETGGETVGGEASGGEPFLDVDLGVDSSGQVDAGVSVSGTDLSTEADVSGSVDTVAVDTGGAEVSGEVVVQEEPDLTAPEVDADLTGGVNVTAGTVGTTQDPGISSDVGSEDLEATEEEAVSDAGGLL